MDLIVAVSSDWGIGCQGQLMVTPPKDMAWFRSKTQEQILVYGRQTLSSFPQAKPLPKRRNLILSRTVAEISGAEVVPQIADLPKYLSRSDWQQTMVIGGGQIYRQLLPYCTQAWVTVFDVHQPFDTDFPNLEQAGAWQLSWQSEWEIDSKTNVRLQFRCYQNQLLRTYDDFCAEVKG